MQKFAMFSALLSGALLASVASAGAQQPPADPFAQGSGTNGWYLRLAGGGAWPAAPGGYATGIGQTTTNVSSGFIVGGAAGYKFNAFRAELELEYIQVGIKSLAFYNTGTTINTTGTQSNLAGMVNGYWDFATGTPWVPYVGFGVGIAELGMNNIANASSGKSILNTTAATFAFQGMLGAKYYINSNWAAGAEFRYFKTPDGWFVNADGLSTSAGNAQYNVLVGLTYHFGTPK
jgi:opacity protein-like surface antigen